MPTSVADKLSAVITEIDERGNADRLRLTVLKKWFERSGRLTSFALWVARRAAYRGGERREAGAELAREAQALLKGVESSGSLDRFAAERLHDRLHTYQSTHRRLQWGTVRVVTDPNLLLIEEALAVYLWYATTPSLGYKLAAAYCEHYDPRYGPGLNGPSRDRLQELIAFVRAREAQEVAHSRPSARDA
jgi:hypothetical protein